MKTTIPLPIYCQRVLGHKSLFQHDAALQLTRMLVCLPCLLFVMLLAAHPLLAVNPLPPGDAERPPVLILYSDWHTSPYATRADIEGCNASLCASLQYEQLLGHFPYTARRVRFSEYHPGMLAHYPYVFVIVNQQTALLPASLLRDVRRYQGACYWVNNGLQQLGSEYLNRLGIAYQRLDTDPGFSTVHYRGITLSKGDTATHLIRVTAPRRCHVLAQATNTHRAAVPYIINSGHFWYVADSPSVCACIGDRYFAFADTLFDFFGVQSRQTKRAFLRIEDINVTVKQAHLRAMATQLYQLHVPFMMAVIPRYQDATSAQMDTVGTTMTSVPDYMATLQFMVAHGGSVVMHGWNHRYHGMSGVDAEFWNANGDRTRADDSVALVASHLRNGLKDCFSAHIYPLAFEAPHYDASMLDYSVIARHFTTAVEQRGLMNRPDFSQFFPFVIRRDIYGQQIFPENLGYIEEQYTPEHQEDLLKEEQEVDAIIRNAKTLSVLREVTLGAFIHPSLNPSLIGRLAHGLKNAGYTFIDLRTEQNSVQLDDMLIATGAVHRQLRLNHQYLHEFFFDTQGNIQREHYSQQEMTGVIQRVLTVPTGWVYVCCGDSRQADTNPDNS